MSRLNIPRPAQPIFTHEGAKAARVNPEAQLRRSVLSCLLWEKEFYEDGQSIADRIRETAQKCSTQVVGALALEARNNGLRHVPLLLLVELIRRRESGVDEIIGNVIQRVDEIPELLTMYWADPNNRHMPPAQLRKGLAKAFRKFDEYAFAKYDRADQTRLRDALQLSHPVPVDEAQSELFRRIDKGELATPITWEVRLSRGEDKKTVFTEMLVNTLDMNYRDPNNRLGYLALLRNLRNMVEAGVDMGLIRQAIINRRGSKYVFPFRYTAAARIVPQLEPTLDAALQLAIAEMESFAGETIVLTDVSSSMDAKLSSKSDLTRLDAAATLASVFPGNVRMFTFSNSLVEVPPRRGMAGVDAIRSSQPHGGTVLFDAVDVINREYKYDRLVVITDEQATGKGFSLGGIQIGRVASLPDPKGIGYMINVASATNGVGYGEWTHIDGFSEAVLRFIRENENQNAALRF